MLKKAAIEHEIGHTFGLKHAPGEWAQIQRIPFAGLEQHPNHNHIEGFRLNEADSDRGYNKSCDEGNAESNKLVDLMYPYLTALERKDQFISGLDYDRVSKHFKDYMPSRTVMNQPDFSVFDGGLADVSGNIFRFLDLKSTDKNILIQGDISKEGIAVIRHMSVTEMSLKGISNNKGSYRLVALDSADNPLFTDNFAPDSVAGDLENTWPLDKKYFTSVIPYDKGIAKFEVVHKNQVLGSYTISDHQPVVEFTNIEKGAKLKRGKNEIQWNASDLDNDPLEFTLSYSPNGINHWQVIGRTDKTSVSFDTEYLSIGDRTNA